MIINVLFCLFLLLYHGICMNLSRPCVYEEKSGRYGRMRSEYSMIALK
jgi:hypothetical protein